MFVLDVDILCNLCIDGVISGCEFLFFLHLFVKMFLIMLYSYDVCEWLVFLFGSIWREWLVSSCCVRTFA